MLSNLIKNSFHGKAAQFEPSGQISYGVFWVHCASQLQKFATIWTKIVQGGALLTVEPGVTSTTMLHIRHMQLRSEITYTDINVIVDMNVMAKLVFQ